MIGPQEIQAFLNGDILRSGWLRKQYKLLALIAVLVFVYILGGYNSMQQHHRLSDLKNEVRDAKFEYLTISAKRAEMTRQSQIVRALNEHGSPLRENRKPAVEVRP